MSDFNNLSDREILIKTAINVEHLHECIERHTLRLSILEKWRIWVTMFIIFIAGTVCNSLGVFQAIALMVR